MGAGGVVAGGAAGKVRWRAERGSSREARLLG